MLTHQWRSEQQAIMVGTRTAAVDNPQLNTRAWTGPDPLRINLDRQLSLPGNLKVFDQSQPTLVYNVQKGEASPRLEWVKLAAEPDLLPAVLADLHARNIQSVLVEGGAVLLNSFLQAGLWDEAHVFKCSRKLEAAGIPAPTLPLSQMQQVSHLGADVLITYKNI